MIICCDNSELRVIKGLRMPDAVLIGGYALDRAAFGDLETAVRSLKKDLCGDPFLPIKWNLKDVKPWIEERHGPQIYNALVASSQDIRSAVIAELVKARAVCVVSVIGSYSSRRTILKRIKPELVRYSFANMLQRYGMLVKERAPRGVEMLLDWPDGSDRSPFINEYYSGWTTGRTVDGGEYFSGPLMGLGFEQGPRFACMELTLGVQLADLVVGASREFVQHALDGAKKGSFGVEQFKVLRNSFHGASAGRIIGRGLVISPANSKLTKKIQVALDAL